MLKCLHHTDVFWLLQVYPLFFGLFNAWCKPGSEYLSCNFAAGFHIDIPTCLSFSCWCYFLQLYIGCVYHNVSTSRWLSWRFVCCMVLSHHIWMISFVSPADLPGRRRLRSSSSHELLFHHSGSQPSVDAHFQSLHLSSATQLAAIWHPVIPVSARLLPTSNTISFFPIFSQYSSVTLLHLCGLRNSSAVLATLKNLIDTLTSDDFICLIWLTQSYISSHQPPLVASSRLCQVQDGRTDV